MPNSTNSARVVEERQVGSVKVTIVETPAGSAWSICMSDRFGIHGSLTGRSQPSEGAIAAAVLRHVHFSQYRTGRN